MNYLTIIEIGQIRTPWFSSKRFFRSSTTPLIIVNNLYDYRSYPMHCKKLRPLVVSYAYPAICRHFMLKLKRHTNPAEFTVKNVTTCEIFISAIAHRKPSKGPHSTYVMDESCGVYTANAASSLPCPYSGPEDLIRCPIPVCTYDLLIQHSHDH